ncbi:MAG: hypothetical protein ACRDV7_06560, partial [Acidimicrobiia bacterium]
MSAPLHPDARIRQRRWVLTVVMTAFVALGIVIVAIGESTDGSDPTSAGRGAPNATRSDALPSTEAASTSAPTTVALRTDVVVDPASFGTPWGSVVEGLLTFRG